MDLASKLFKGDRVIWIIFMFLLELYSHDFQPSMRVISVHADKGRHDQHQHRDRQLWIIFMFLCLISVVEVFSATSTIAYKNANHWAPIVRHATFLLGGFVMVLRSILSFITNYVRKP